MIRLPKAPLACALALLLVSGCAQPQKTETADPFMDKWKAKAQESKGASPAPSTAPRDVVKETAARPVDVRQDVEKPLPVKRVSLKMSNVDVSVLLRALARAADVNIILNERVTGRSNINITQAPWDQVFLGILRTHNLTYAWQGDIIRIMTADDLEEDLRRETRKRDLLIGRIAGHPHRPHQVLRGDQAAGNRQGAADHRQVQQSDRRGARRPAHQLARHQRAAQGHQRDPGGHRQARQAHAPGPDRSLHRGGQQGRGARPRRAVGRRLPDQRRRPPRLHHRPRQQHAPARDRRGPIRTSAAGHRPDHGQHREPAGRRPRRPPASASSTRTWASSCCRPS